MYKTNRLFGLQLEICITITRESIIIICRIEGGIIIIE